MATVNECSREVIAQKILDDLQQGMSSTKIIQDLEQTFNIDVSEEVQDLAKSAYTDSWNGSETNPGTSITEKLSMMGLKLERPKLSDELHRLSWKSEKFDFEAWSREWHRNGLLERRSKLSDEDFHKLVEGRK